ncbi:TonB-dependent siderophore receptor [Nostoc sp.]|uniref:TonB-dependent siderophore receptor n=1 Tax=Nostoc sp. TaxID=1180 RepID=UPI002FFBE8CC
MKRKQLWQLLAIIGWIGLAIPAYAKEVLQPIRRLQVSDRAIILVQSPASEIAPLTKVVQVTAVKANPTDKGVEVILQTDKGQKLQVVNRSVDNSFIADIPNAQLRLTKGDTFRFRSEKPLAGIIEITVTNFNANTIRVTVRGEAGVPIVELFDSPDEGLIFSVASSIQPQTQPPQSDTKPSQPSAQSDEPIELVVTGEQDTGYSVPDASTATKTDTPLRDIPQSIQVIPRRVIEDQKITRLSDALRNVAGVITSGNRRSLAPDYVIRGFTTQNTLRNGFAFPGSSTTPANASAVSNNIERIEVLKGPASVLYGNLEPGGVVNYVTKQPLETPYYAGEFIVGSDSFYNPTLDFSGPLTTDKQLLYRVNIGYENSGSFVDFVNRENFSIAPTLSYKIGDSTTLNFGYEYIRQDGTPYEGFPANPLVFQLPRNRFLGEPGDRQQSDTHNINFAISHRFNDNLEIRSGFFTQFTNSKGSSFRLDFGDIDGSLAPRFYETGTDDNQLYSLQNDLIWKFNTGSVKHQLLFGLEWTQSIGHFNYDDNSADYSIDIFEPVYGATIPREFNFFSSQKKERNTIALYLQDQVTLLPNLKLLVGGRYDFNKQTDIFIEFNNINPDEPSVFNETNEVDANAFSPRVGIVYQPIEPVSLYASFSRSFVPNDSRTRTGEIIEPTRGTQYEAGIKTELLDNKLSATLAAYEITKTNIPTTDPQDRNYSIGVGEVKSRGVEFSLAGEPLQNLNIIASLFFNDTFVSEDNNLPVGDKLINAPSQGASLWMSYEIPKGDFKGLGFGAGVFYVGDREVTLPNTFTVSSYVRTDAAIFYKQDNWQLGLNFKNLFNKRYFETDGFIQPGEPLTVLGSISVRF